MRTSYIALTAAAFLLAVSQAAAQSSPPRGLEDARADFDAGDYPACLRKVASQLSSNTVKRDSPERHDLLMLRGECLVRLKQRTPAAEAFEKAAAVTKGRGDLPRTANATALAALVKASPDLKYTPKARSGGPAIDVANPETRREAMAALFEDLKAQLAPDVEKALQDKSLTSTQRRLKQFWELYAVEFAATGTATSTERTLQDVGGHARNLIADELDRLISRLEHLSDLAGEPVWGANVMGYRGLKTSEQNEIRKMADYLMEIQRTVENGRRIAQALGRTGENWDFLLADCAVARDAAQQAYDRRY
ncbi:MAG TPA: hypothetical protein VFB66_20870 [Tepidisphaeraceae bacterium]|nr:hypothetical protein [Tepidisphaeraceae bacterium]